MGIEPASSIEFTIRPSALDAARAVRDAQRQDLWWVGGTVVAVLMGLYAIGLVYGGNAAGGVLLAGITAALVAIWLASARWLAYLAERRHPQAYNRDIHVRLDADGLYSEWGASRGTRAWSDMNGYVESRDYFILRWGRLMVAFFPKAQLTPEAVRAVRALLQDHLGRQERPAHRPPSR